MGTIFLLDELISNLSPSKPKQPTRRTKQFQSKDLPALKLSQSVSSSQGKNLKTVLSEMNNIEILDYHLRIHNDLLMQLTTL